ncbi:CHAD domain-containing protein [Daejeonella oryzae]|uniref:CHAD domain-containing protein n=1 Tax=Daejeonella oryzae TaxID=1122943 RepID=UPI00138AE6D0|nr:CHAD domain-containing protein [Daejeonella oryzae]
MNAFCQRKNAEDLHQMRVEIKKLNAFIFFLKKQFGSNFYANILSPVKNIFKEAGVIRTAQVNLELAKKIDLKNPNVINDLIKRIDTGSLEFCMNRLEASKMMQRFVLQMLPSLKEIRTSRIKKFFRKEIEKSNPQLLGKLSTKEWHHLRKKIKILLYVHQFLNEDIQMKIKLNRSYLNNLQESIGMLHDVEIVSGLIDRNERAGKALVKKLGGEMALQERCLHEEIQNYNSKVFSRG